MPISSAASCRIWNGAVTRHECWSRKTDGAARNLIANHGTAPLERFAADFPHLNVTTYGAGFNHEAALDGADVVIVHEWTPGELVARIGRLRQSAGRFALLFHDTHHRGVSEAASIEQLPLQDYDAVFTWRNLAPPL